MFYLMDETLAEFEGYCASIFVDLQFIPLRVEHLSYLCAHQYIGISTKFDLLKDGELLPEYEILLGYNGETESFDPPQVKRLK